MTDKKLPQNYQNALEPHVRELLNIIDKILPLTTEFGNVFTCARDDVAIIIKKGK